MRRGLVQQDNVETLPLGLAKLVQKEAKALGVQVRHLPPEGFPGGGFDRRIEPVRLIERLDDLDRLHTVAGEATVQGQVQASTTFILTEHPHGLVGRLSPSGGDGPEAARALWDQVSRLRHFFLAWLGRGRLHLALS